MESTDLPQHYKKVLSVPQQNKLIEILNSQEVYSFKKSLFLEYKLDDIYDIIDLIVKECVETSYKIYNSLLENSKQEPITLICGGQSPAYFCYAMMHLNPH